MLPETHPLINSITQPFADDVEMKLSVRQILEDKFDPAHPSVPQMIERFEKKDGRKFSLLGKIAIWVLALSVLGFCVYQERFMIWTAEVYQSFHDFETPTPSLQKGLSEKDQLLLGDPKLDELTQKRMLFESDQTNPAYFTEYLGSYTSINRRMPENYLETVKRIDPNNSNYLYWEAGLVIGDDAIEKKTYDTPSRRSRRKAPTPPESTPPPPPPPRIVDGYRLKPLPVEQEFVINDQVTYEKALDLIEQATELPELNNYEAMMMKARMSIVRGSNTYPEFIRAITIQFSSSSCGTMSLFKVSTVMNARAEELSKSGQREEFLRFAAQRDALMFKLAKSEAGSLVKELVYFNVASSTATNFLAAAERLELADLTEKYRKEYDGFVAERDRQELSRYQSSTNLLEKHGSTLSRLSLPMMDNRVKSPPILSDDDIKPLRMAEHELLGRWGILSAALALSVAALLIFFFRYLVSLPIRNTAKRFAGLLRLSDWLWIVGLGIVPSVLFFIYISRYSPVSGRNYGAVYFLFVYPGLHLSVLLLNLLLAPAVVTRWRLKRRAAAFEFGSMLDLLSLPVFVVMLIYSFAAYPVLTKYNLTLPVQIGLAAPLVGWLGFAFFNGLRIILGSASSRIIQTATSMAVIPAYALTIIALCSILPIYHAGEKFWIPQDKVHLIDPNAADLGAYEFRIAAQKQKETNAILGIE
jgi:hypothetical protein